MCFVVVAMMMMPAMMLVFARYLLMISFRCLVLRNGCVMFGVMRRVYCESPAAHKEHCYKRKNKTKFFHFFTSFLQDQFCILEYQYRKKRSI